MHKEEKEARSLNNLPKAKGGTSVAVQWLRFHTFNARGAGLILVWGTKIPQAAEPKKKKKRKKKKKD